MQIVVVRHGIAVERLADGSDHAERALTPEGLRKIQAVARALRRLELKPERLISSPYLRARQTALVIGQGFDLPVETNHGLAPGGSWQGLIKQLEQEQPEQVILVGHEPDLSMLVSSLIGGGNLHLKKGGVAVLELPPDPDTDGMLLWLLTPRILQRIAGS